MLSRWRGAVQTQTVIRKGQGTQEELRLKKISRRRQQMLVSGPTCISGTEECLVCVVGG